MAGPINVTYLDQQLRQVRSAVEGAEGVQPVVVSNCPLFVRIALSFAEVSIRRQRQLIVRAPRSLWPYLQRIQRVLGVEEVQYEPVHVLVQAVFNVDDWEGVLQWLHRRCPYVSKFWIDGVVYVLDPSLSFGLSIHKIRFVEGVIRGTPTPLTSVCSVRYAPNFIDVETVSVMGRRRRGQWWCSAPPTLALGRSFGHMVHLDHGNPIYEVMNVVPRGAGGRRSQRTLTIEEEVYDLVSV